ncbi:hypothetical protein [Salinicoccus albus]|uniref:hypothetical protein n=1 Tax=Salinicoccus albus TaxID=418756 RepID=UPI00036D9FF7|nr:hypothetical protein [Salinicoccus albus]
MLSISTRNEIVKFRPEESLRHHMLFEETFTYYCLSQYVENNEISDIAGSASEEISENDIALYYVDINKMFTLNRSPRHWTTTKRGRLVY